MKRILGSVCALTIAFGALNAPVQAHAATTTTTTTGNDDSKDPDTLTALVGSAAIAGITFLSVTAPFFILVNGYHQLVDSGQMQPIPNELIPGFIH
ncbi:MAG: hypothetical protein Q3961_02840 [Bifidobacteriaceae bacterium]|nr:hypothetical protein [Bifidobacteriaceae bacterium]